MMAKDDTVFKALADNSRDKQPAFTSPELGKVRHPTLIGALNIKRPLLAGSCPICVKVKQG
jgi:hypothetical protein